MSLAVETGRFLVTALAAAFAVVACMVGISVATGTGMPYDGFVLVLVPAFVFAIIGGWLCGLPFLFFAKKIGLDGGRGKMGLSGVFVGGFAGLLMTIPTYGSVAQFSFPREILPFWLGMGAVAGLVASQVWLTLHRLDDA